jgi:CBS domain-containing protein
MNCNQAMTRNPVFCEPLDSVSHAAHLMRQKGVGALPVVSDWRSKKLIGIVTDRDLALRVVAEALNADDTTVAEVMTPVIMACRAQDDVSGVMKIMEIDELRRIPIVDSHDCLVGIVSRADLEEEDQGTPRIFGQMSRAA